MPRVAMSEVVSEVQDDLGWREELAAEDADWSWYDDWMMMQIEQEEEQARSEDEGSFFDDVSLDPEGDVTDTFRARDLELQQAEQVKEQWLAGADL